MKRVIFLVIIIIICMLFFVSCSKNDITAYKDREINLPVTFEAYDIAVDEDGDIYVCARDSIHIMDINGLKTSEITHGLDFCRNIAYNFSKKTLYVLDSKGSQLNLYNKKGEITGNLSIDIEGFTLRMESDGNYIIFLQQDKQNHTKKYIEIYNIKDNKVEILNYENVLAFSLYPDNSICIILDETHTFDANMIIYDCKTGKEKNKRALSLPTAINDIAYKSDEGILYFSMEDTLKSFNFDKGNTNTIIKKSGFNILKILFYRNICVLLCKDNENSDSIIHTVDIQNFVRSDSKVLTLLSYNPGIDRDQVITSAVNSLQKNNPDISVKFISIEHSKYLTALIKKLSAGDSDFDIYYLNNDDSYDFLKNEALVDLSLYPDISLNFDRMLEGIRSVCEYNRKIPGIPWNISFDVWNINDTMLKKLGIELPDGSWTWEEFYHIARKLKSNLDEDEINETYALEYNKRFFTFLIVNSYNCKYYDMFSEKIEYDNQEFENLLELVKNLWDEQLIAEENAIYGSSSSYHDRKSNILFNAISNPHIDEFVNGKWLLPPSISRSEPYYPIGINMMCINTNML